MGLGQYNSLGEYCGPHTASSVFLDVDISFNDFVYFNYLLLELR